MRTRRGFTIVEIVIVMVIMAILLGLGFVVMTRTQANARDTKRNTDMENIARGLENRYKTGNPRATATNAKTGAGTYPGINELFHLMGWKKPDFNPDVISGGYGPDDLPGTSIQNFSPPGYTSGAYAGFDGLCNNDCQLAETKSVIDATFSNATRKTMYFYEPIDADGNVCSDGPCVRFNLYWMTEVDNQVHTIRSRHQ